MTTEIKSESAIRAIYFGENGKTENSAYELTNHQNWCKRSETRLFQKVLDCKPAGINKHFNLSRLTYLLSNIHEDENTDFEMFLTPEDLELYKCRKETKDKKDLIIFKPSYKIRPTPKQILEKLREYYNVEIVNKNEALDDQFCNESDFFFSYIDTTKQSVDLIRTPQRRLREPNF